MPFSLVQFFVRLLHAFVLFMCVYTFNQAEAQTMGQAYGPPAPASAVVVAKNQGMKDGIKSYENWKKERVLQAKNQIELIQSRISKRISDLAKFRLDISTRTKSRNKLNSTKDTYLDALHEQMKIEQENLEFASNLSISDYLISYIIRQKNQKTSFLSAAAQLSDEEVAELIQAFAHKLEQKGSKTLSPTAELFSDQAY